MSSLSYPPTLNATGGVGWTEVVGLGEQVVLGGVGVVMVVVGGVGNGMVVVLVCRTPAMRSSINLLLATGAFCDGLATSLLLPLDIMSLLGRGWLLPALLCPAHSFLSTVVRMEGVAVLTIICVDRYILLIHRHDLLTQPLACWVIAGTWILSASITLLPLLGLGTFTPLPLPPALTHCLWRTWKTISLGETVYACVSFGVSYFLPALVMVFCFARIRTKSAKVHVNGNTNEMTGGCFGVRGQPRGQNMATDMKNAHDEKKVVNVIQVRGRTGEHATGMRVTGKTKGGGTMDAVRRSVGETGVERDNEEKGRDGETTRREECDNTSKARKAETQKININRASRTTSSPCYLDNIAPSDKTTKTRNTGIETNIKRTFRTTSSPCGLENKTANDGETKGRNTVEMAVNDEETTAGNTEMETNIRRAIRTKSSPCRFENIAPTDGGTTSGRTEAETNIKLATRTTSSPCRLPFSIHLRYKKRKVTTIMLLSLVLLVCRTPLSFALFVHSLSSSPLTYRAFPWLLWWAYLQPVLFPVIYAFRIRKFRQELLDLFPCLIRLAPQPERKRRFIYMVRGDSSHHHHHHDDS